jgi:hypothetical protein
MTSGNTLENMRYKFDKVVDELLLDFVHTKLDLYKKLSDPKVNPVFKSKWFEGYLRESKADILTGGGSLHNIWQQIRERLHDEETNNSNINERLHLKLLLLDPISGAGKFRANIEKNTIGAVGLDFDIPTAIDQVSAVIKSIYKSEQTEFIQIRLYEHCPFSFLFITENSAMVEQYCYRDHGKPSLPLIEYACHSDAHAQLQYSFNQIWNGARNLFKKKYFIGYADGIQKSKIANIFRHDKRDVSGGGQIECIKQTGPNEEINIQAITGKFYVNDAVLEAISDISIPSSKLLEPVKISFLIINPISPQAIIRAIADSCSPDQIGETLKIWDWNTHKDSKLYTHVEDTVRCIGRLKERKAKIDLKLTNASLSSSLFITPRSAFVEQYIFGRSARYQQKTRPLKSHTCSPNPGLLMQNKFFRIMKEVVNAKSHRS